MTETQIQPEAREVRWIAIMQAAGAGRSKGNSIPPIPEYRRFFPSIKSEVLGKTYVG